MKIPWSLKNIKHENGARSEDEDTDVTMVTEIRNAKYIEQNAKSQINEESESLLNGFKKKNKKHKRGSNEHKGNTQSDLFPTRIDTPEPSEMADESNVSHKRKKRKVHHEENTEPDNNKRKRRDSVELLSQDIFSQSSSIKFLSSTPFPTPKKERKKKKKEKMEEKEDANDSTGKAILINGEFVSQNNMTSIFNGVTSENDNQNGLENSTLDPNDSFNTDSNEQNISKSTNDNISSSSETTVVKKKKKNNKDFLSEDSKELNETKKIKKKSKNDNEDHIDRLRMDFDLGHDSLSLEFPKIKQKKKKGSKERSNCISYVKEEVDISKEGDLLSPTLDSGARKKRKKRPIEYSESIENMKEEIDIDEVKLVDISLSQSLDVCDELIKDESQYLDGHKQENDYDSDEGVEFDEDAAFKVTNFDIDFKVPPLHKILDRASKPTKPQRDKIKSMGIIVKQGKFTKVEDNQIKENWQHFIEVKNLEDNPNIFFCLDKQVIPKKLKRLFLFYLARDMPERTPYSVFRRFKLLLGRQKRGRFTEEEDEAILKVINNKSRSHNYVAELANQLERGKTAIAHRIQAMQNTYTRKIKWKGRNAATFIKYMLKVTGTAEENLQDLKDRPITAKEWTKLSKKLDGIPVKVLKRVWLEKLHPALFMSCDHLNLREVRLELVNMFIKNNETDWRNVNWRHYASQFPGLTYLRVYSIMKALVNVHVPEYKRNNLKKSLKCLSKADLAANIRNKVIRKIKYENGEVS